MILYNIVLNVINTPACSVFGCSNNSGLHPHVRYYYFPNKEKFLNLHKIWVNCTKKKQFLPTRNAIICGQHISDTDFNESDILKAQLLPKEKFRHPMLKENAIPSKYLGPDRKSSPKKTESSFKKEPGFWFTKLQ